MWAKGSDKITAQVLTLKHREMHGCIVSTVATDALVLKHQAISILSTDSIYWTSFKWKYYTFVGQHLEIKLHIEKKYPVV